MAAIFNMLIIVLHTEHTYFALYTRLFTSVHSFNSLFDGFLRETTIVTGLSVVFLTSSREMTSR
jgi:hypothetical protein